MSGIFPDLEILLKRLNGQPALCRFAPSPTGFLHLGHVVNAIYVWGITRRLGGKVLLRIEDHDRQRCRPEYEQAIHEDLAWLGLHADLGTPEDFSAGRSDFRQSDNEEAYQAAMAQLRSRGHVYACDCSRKDIQARTEGQDSEELRYDGFCRDRALPDGPDCGIRLQLPDDPLSFDDLLVGAQVQTPARQCGDLLLRDRHRQWTYQFAVVVDDLRQDINLVIRGQDILESTARQLLMGKVLNPAFGPVYLHHPLLTDEHGRKLSKRDFDADIHKLKLAGLKAETVLGKAAALAGLLPEERELSAEELPGLFA